MTAQWSTRIKRWFSKRELLLISVIALAALLVRIYGINFGLPYLYTTDEAWQVNYALAFGATRDLTLTPGYPPLLMYLLFVLYGVYFAIGFVVGVFRSLEDFAIQFFRDPSMIYLIGRAFVALLGTATIILAYLTGRKGYNSKVGLVAALFLAFSFTHVEYSHYIKSHGVLAFFALLSFFFILRVWEQGRIQDYILAGLFCGLSVGMLQPGIFLTIPLFLAHLFRVLNTRKSYHEIFRGAAFVSLAVWILGLVASNPPLLLDTKGALEFAIKASQNYAYVAGNLGSGWIGHIFLLRNTMGLFLGVIAVMGIAYALWHHRQKDLLLISFPLVYLLFFSCYRAKVGYHVLPTHPFLAVLGASFLVDMTSRLRLSEAVRTAVLVLLVSAVIMPSAVAVLSWDYRISQKDTRTIAKEWIEKRLPGGSKILIDSGKYYVSSLSPPISDSRENLEKKYLDSLQVKPEETKEWLDGRRANHPYASEFYRYSLAATVGITYDLTRILNDDFSSSIDIHPLRYYREQGIQYVIVSWASYSSYLSPDYPFPEKAAAYRAFYDSLDREAILLKEFPSLPNRPGPTIKIYKLDGKP